MKKLISLCLVLLFLLTAGCAKPAEEAPEGPKLWFVSDLKQWSAGATALADMPYFGPITVPDMMGALLAGPLGEDDLRSPIPRGTELQKWNLANGILYLDLSRPYGNLVGLDLTLADYCIALTMTQMPQVRGVYITVDGSEIRYRDRQILYADDVVFSGAEEEPVELTAPLYFRRMDSGELGYELRLFLLTESELPTLAVLEALAAGPQDEGLLRLLPEGVTVYSARVDEGVCYADFSAALMLSVPSDEEDQRLILASVVETLCSLEAVNSVQILVEGETRTFYGSVDISQPLKPEK